MAPKSRPKLARFVFTVGMVLAVAAIILGITTRNLAAPSASLIYSPDPSASAPGAVTWALALIE